MENPNEYNGWSNWETWNVVLWFSNDEELYKGIASVAGSWLPNSAEAYAKLVMPDGTPDFDDTDGGYSVVNWDEVADAWNEE